MESETKKNKIICIGNRLIPEDSLAMAVYDLLTGSELNGDLYMSKQFHEKIEIIEGGIAGLNLLAHLENSGNIVFVDTVSGFLPPENGGSWERSTESSAEIIVLTQQEITDCLQIDDCHYGHDSGIAYLLSVLPIVCEGSLPKSIFLVGLGGKFSHEKIEQAAKTSIKIAQNGYE